MAPTIGAVTPGFDNIHASATCARGTPRAAATSRPLDDGAVRAVGVEVLAERVALRALRLVVPGAGQAAARERAPRDHADALVDAQRQHLALLLAVQQVVVVLHRDERVQPCASAVNSALANCQAYIDDAPM